MLWLRFCALFAGLLAVTQLCAATDELKQGAIARLAASHDPAIPIAIGRAYVKQAGLLAVQRLLDERGRVEHLGSSWGPQAPEWQAAQAELAPILDDIIANGIDNPAWLREGWAAASARVLNAEEADYIAQHFATTAGARQRQVIEMLIVGETLMAYYTFTDRLRYDVPGAQRELEQLQSVWWEREPFKLQDFTDDRESMRFAASDAGVKYCRMLAIQGIEAINAHYATVVKQTEAALHAQQRKVDPHIEAFLARTRRGQSDQLHRTSSTR
jgi:hypothetical protein